MARKKFGWEHLPDWLLRDLTRDQAVEVGDEASALQSWYGTRPTDLFVRERWEWLREDWLARDHAARRTVVNRLSKLDLGRHPGGTGDAVEMAYLRSCRNAGGLRQVVLDEFINLGQPDVTSVKRQQKPSSTGSAAGKATDEPSRPAGQVESLNAGPADVPTLPAKSALYAQALEHKAGSHQRAPISPASAFPAQMSTSQPAGRSAKMRIAVIAVLATGLAGGTLMTLITGPDDDVTPKSTPSVSPNEPPSSAGDDEPTASTTTSPPISKPVTTPLVGGSYSGVVTVTRDEANTGKGNPRNSSSLGRRFERTINIGNDCDDPDPLCTISFRSLSLYFLTGVETRQWAVSEDGASVTFEKRRQDDCVTNAGKKVGSFDTTITATMTFHSPENTGGVRRWRVADLVYLEDAFSDDKDEGCFTSAYAVKGQFKRNSVL